MGDREELAELRRLDELQARAAAAQPKGAMTELGDAAMGGLRAGGPHLAALAASAHLMDKAANWAGGTATDYAASKGASPEVAGALGTAANLATGFVPFTGAGAVAGNAVKPLFQAGARDLMGRALKPAIKAQKMERAEPAIQTMLDEGANVSKSGAEKLQGRIDALNTEIEAAIKGSGVTLDKGKVGARIQDVINKIEGSQATPQDNVKLAMKVYDDFLANGVIPKNIPVEQAQRVKQGIYGMLKDEYGKLGSATVESQKAIARGLKEDMSAAIPSVGPMNSKESEIINALQLAEHRAMVEGNKNHVGIGAIASNPAMFMAFMADRSAAFKSAVANLLYKRNTPTAIGAATGAAASSSQEQQ